MINQIKENEHLYMNFRKKYEEALYLIKSLHEEKINLNNILRKSLEEKKKNLYYYQSSNKENKSYYSFNDNSEKENEIESNSNSKIKSIKKLLSPKTFSSIQISEFSEKENNNNNYNNNINSFQEQFDKLNDEYINILNEKKDLENELINKNILIENYEKNTKELQSLKEINENYEICIEKKNNELSTLKNQILKLSNEKEELNKGINALRQSQKILESEKNTIKNKYNQNLNKFKNMEKEIIILKNKNNNLTNDIKLLIQKNNNKSNDYEFKIKDLNKKIDEYENKIINLEELNKNITKETISTFIKNSINSKNGDLIKFFYEPKSNKIKIQYLNEVKAIVDNSNKENQSPLKKNKKINDSKSSKKNIELVNNSLLKYKQMNFYNNNYLESPFASNEKEKISLSKLFSNNKFSASSIDNNQYIENKENNNMLNTLMNITINTNSNIVNDNIFKENQLTSAINQIEIKKNLMIKKNSLNFEQNKFVSETKKFNICQMIAFSLINNNNNKKFFNLEECKKIEFYIFNEKKKIKFEEEKNNSISFIHFKKQNIINIINENNFNILSSKKNKDCNIIQENNFFIFKTKKQFNCNIINSEIINIIPEKLIKDNNIIKEINFNFINKKQKPIKIIEQNKDIINIKPNKIMYSINQQILFSFLKNEENKKLFKNDEISFDLNQKKNETILKKDYSQNFMIKSLRKHPIYSKRPIKPNKKNKINSFCFSFLKNNSTILINHKGNKKLIENYINNNNLNLSEFEHYNSNNIQSTIKLNNSIRNSNSIDKEIYNNQINKLNKSKCCNCIIF